MRMQDRATVADAQRWVDEQFVQCSTESIDVSAAANRILGESIVAPLNVPAFRRAMMDGYAVTAAQTVGASDRSPALFDVVGEQLPGQPAVSCPNVNSAIRITTGAPMPAGTDSVVPVEYTHAVGAKVACETGLSTGKHVGEVGEDIKAGEVVYSSGRKIRPQDIGVIASLGISKITVQSKPVTNIVVTGNEIISIGQNATTNQIFDANGPMLTALIQRDGGQPVFSGIIPDDSDQIAAAMELDADIIILSGGSSAGHEDFAPDIVKADGTLPIHGIAMRPSSPAGMGQYKDKLVFLCPGNPVSCLCAYDFFAGRKIRQLARGNPNWPYRKITATLKKKLVSAIGRTDYARVTVVEDLVTPLAIGGASILTTTTRADGFVVIAADSEGIAAGNNVNVFLYD